MTSTRAGVDELSRTNAGTRWRASRASEDEGDVARRLTASDDATTVRARDRPTIELEGFLRGPAGAWTAHVEAEPLDT